MTKFIFVTGGVLSGLGKGIAAASIGHLLQDYRVIPIKCDGYLNVDPGTMNPYEHGEVFVLEDGAEVDMDFGHYERFLGISTKKEWNLTMGKVFEKIRLKERKGDYLGKTVQYVPHVTRLIKNWWTEVAKKEKADIAVIEIGGTVGDIEADLYLEAARQLSLGLKKEDCLFIHLTYVPIPYGVNEQKSKPTQQSVNLLMSKGINPDVIIGRCNELLSSEIKKKISLFSRVIPEAVITSLDVDNTYKMPLIFEKEGMSKLLEKKLKIKVRPDLRILKQLVKNMDKAKDSITIAIAGKYTRLEDSYASIIESLKHCTAHLRTKINIKWVETTDEKNLYQELEDVDGVIVPGGFGTRGFEGKISVIKYCRQHGIPFLGICLGLQLAVIEFARNIAGISDANTEEVRGKHLNNVICYMPEQRTVTNKGGTMRLGSYPAKLKKGSVAEMLYDTNLVYERHRHRYEVNPSYIKELQHHGLEISGVSPDGKLVEFIELSHHRYFVATQAHPELKSSIFRPAPLFYGLVKAAQLRKLYKTN